MANEEQLALLKQDVAAWNQWRQEHPEIQPDLRQANLNNTNLYKANLNHADLNYAYLSHANLGNASLSNASLIKAKFYKTDLIKATLSHADLSYADLNHADLYKANLNHANLSKATLSHADLSHADLSHADLSEAYLYKAGLSEANLYEATLTKADLTRATLVETNLTGATLTRCSIYGISVWNVQLEGAKQDGLIITPEGEPIITVDDLEVAQFIYLLLNHKKLRNALNAVTERGVLLLGRFGGGGLEVLQAVATRLREEQYLPIIFDFERPQDRNYTETVKTLAGLSRFIIADLSGPSVPQELYATVPHFKIPFVPILEAGRKQFAMAVDLLEYPWVIRPPVIFASTDELVSLVPSRIITPAEEKHQARQQLLNELFNPT
jgi:uncharacterized protein YjbI with pentapeptide repeats